MHKILVATVTEEGDFNPAVPHMGMARLIVVIFLIHAIVIGGIIGYDRLGGDSAPASSSARSEPRATASALPPTAINAAVLEKELPIGEYATYEWRSNDSLPKVAEKLRVTQEELIRLNMLDKGAQIEPNSILRYPRQPAVRAVGIGVAGAEGAAAQAASVLDSPPAPAAGLAAAAAPAIGLEMPGESTFSLSPNIMHELAQAPDLSVNPALEVVALPDDPPAAPAAAPAPAAAEPAQAPVLEQPPAPVTAPPVEKPVPKATPYTPPAAPPVKKPAPAPAVKAAPRTAAASHTVKAGENLYRIATRHNVSVKAIQDANKLKNPDHIREGMKLVIPAR